jgi:alkylated DNA repair protein (DNA oxidative demethylase)
MWINIPIPEENWSKVMMLFNNLPDGITILREYLTREQQELFIEKSRQAAKQAPLLYPRMRRGNLFHVRVTSVGQCGWWSDEQRGFGYVKHHPETQQPFPPMPADFRALAVRAAAEVGCNFEPDTCLINFYDIGDGRLGLHQDENERDRTQPIVTVSLGDSCIFEVGGETRSVKPQEIRLDSGDVLIMYEKGRMLYHGVKEIIPCTSNILKNGGRVSLTLRKAL